MLATRWEAKYEGHNTGGSWGGSRRIRIDGKQVEHVEHVR